MMNKVQIKEKIAQLKEQFPLHVAVFENNTEVCKLLIGNINLAFA